MMAREVTQTDELQDPNKFVETGLHLTCVKGHHDYGRGRVTETSSFTYHNIVGLHQRLSNRNTDSITGSPDQIVSHRRLIGLYKKHARVDLDAILKLLDCTDKDKQFGTIDTQCFFATFGRVTLSFHLLYR